jgi:hypothetical protein
MALIPFACFKDLKENSSTILMRYIDNRHQEVHRISGAELNGIRIFCFRKISWMDDVIPEETYAYMHNVACRVLANYTNK